MSSSGCDSKHSGFVRWWQLVSMCLSLLVITVTILLFEANAMIATDNNSRARDSSIIETIGGIHASLARIEAKLETIK